MSWLVAVTVAIPYSLPAFADVSKNEDLIRYRRADMVVAKRHFERLSQIAKGKLAYQKELVVLDLTVMRLLSQTLVADYPVGSDSGGETKAAPEIWREWDKFKAIAEKYQSALQKTQGEIPKDAREVKRVVDDIGRACKACHDDYKKS